MKIKELTQEEINRLYNDFIIMADNVQRYREDNEIDEFVESLPSEVMELRDDIKLPDID